MPAPANDHFANATALTGYTDPYSGAPVTFTLTNQTNNSATPEGGEPDLDGLYTVWYSFTPPSSFAFGFEVWFQTLGAQQNMAMDIFVVQSSDSLAAIVLAESPGYPYVTDNSRGIAYTTDAGIALICVYPYKYYIRVSNRHGVSATGNFTLLYGSPRRVSLGNCSSCPPFWGPCQSATLISSIGIADVNTPQITSFGSVAAGTYTMRYCKGAIHAPQNHGWFVANQWLDENVYATTVILFNNSPTGLWSLGVLDSYGPGWPFNGSPHAQTGPDVIMAAASPVIGSISPDNGVSTGPYDFNTFQELAPWPTQAAAEAYYRCGTMTVGHLGGPIYLCYHLGGIDLPSSSLTVQNGLPNPVWGLYKVNPLMTAAGATWINTVGSVVTLNFLIHNYGAYEFDNVTCTLTGLSGVSSPVATNLPLGLTAVSFSFTLSPSNTIATLTLTNAPGDTFPVLTYLIVPQLLSVGTPNIFHPTNGCGAATTQFTFPILNGSNIPCSASAQAIITVTSGPAMGVRGPGNGGGPGCACVGTAKTTIFGAVSAHGANNSAVYMVGETQATGAVSTITVQLSDGTYSAPPYTLNYTWP